jgi:hypothetical protein
VNHSRLTGLSARTRRRAWAIGAVAAAAALFAPLLLTAIPAGAFGTINGLGQNAEHERITRVLSCSSSQRPTNCFQQESMNLLSGRPGTFGAVGAPDIPPYLFGNPQNHCDDADYNVVGAPNYPQTQAQAHQRLVDCITQAQQRLASAVDFASGLLSNGAINPEAGRADVTCGLPVGVKNADKTAKCSVINQFGRALHTAEDFWSHSNWADVADASRPIGSTNPPGLGRSDVPPYFLYPAAGNWQFPPNLVTGFDDSGPFTKCGDRVCHSNLNKDNGNIDPNTGATSNPSTARGKVSNNFQRAVSGARAQVLATWNSLVAGLQAKYGAGPAALMVRALTNDTPWTTCQLGGQARDARNPPVGDKGAARTVTGKIVNDSGQALNCTTANMDYGEWGVMAPDSVGTGGSGRFKALSNGSSTIGNVTYTLTGGTTVKISWSNPWVGSNNYGCDVGGPNNGQYRCTIGGTQSGFDSSPTFTVSRR